MSLLGVFSLTQAILSYDWVSFLTYFFVIIFGIVFGILEQRKTLEKWSEGYLEYANWITEEMREIEPKETAETEEINITLEEQ